MCARISQQQRLSYGDPFRTRFTSVSLCVCMDVWKRAGGVDFHPSRIDNRRILFPLSTHLNINKQQNNRINKTLPAVV